MLLKTSKIKAPERNRTADLIVTNDVLYRLSYKSITHNVFRYYSGIHKLCQ